MCSQPTSWGTGAGGRWGAAIPRPTAAGARGSARCCPLHPAHTSKGTRTRKCHHPIRAAAQMKMLRCSQLSFEFLNILICSGVLTSERKKLQQQHMGGHVPRPPKRVAAGVGEHQTDLPATKGLR